MTNKIKDFTSGVGEWKDEVLMRYKHLYELRDAELNLCRPYRAIIGEMLERGLIDGGVSKIKLPPDDPLF